MDDQRVSRPHSRRRSERISLAMSSKCRPVVEARRTGTACPSSPAPRAGPSAASARKPASLSRCGLAAPTTSAHRLAELHVVEADVDDRLQPANDLAILGEQPHRLADGEFEHVGDRQLAITAHQVSVQHLGAKAPAVAVGAAQVDVGEELHLHVLEARAAAGRAAPVARVEAEHASAVVALERDRRGREQLADLVEGADGRCPTCGGSGFEHVEMQFLSDIYLRCPDTDGRRFRAEMLDAPRAARPRQLIVADTENGRRSSTSASTT